MSAERATIPEVWRSEAPEDVRRLQDRIRALAAEKDAVILAHNYQLPEVQAVADFTGDSLGLSVQAQEAPQQTIVFCGVHFMAESAKILNPQKTVLLPSMAAGCSLADSITAEELADWKERYPDHVVVTYVNSTAAVKALSDVCCTSANAVSVVRGIEGDKVLFTPDRNLGAWVKKQVPEKEVVIYDGCCPTHDNLRGANLDQLRDDEKDAIVIAHPECREDILDLADEICSTSGMFDAVRRHPEAETFLVATEWAHVDKLQQEFPDRRFVIADGCIGCRLHCPYMKMIGLEQLERSLERGIFEVDVDPEDQEGARRSLERMLAVPRDR
jgi:quinolinate synthase